MEKEKSAKISLCTAMLIFGTIGVFRRFIPLPSGVVAMARGVIGAVFLTILLKVRKVQFHWERVREYKILLAVSGLFLGFNWVLLFEAYRYTTVAAATLCYYMAPVFVILAAAVLLKERLTLKKLACIAAAFLGMVFVSGILQADFGVGAQRRGIFFGLLAAVLYAGVVLLNRKLKEVPAYEKTVCQLAVAAVVLVPYSICAGQVEPGTLTFGCFAMLLLVGIVHTGIAYALYFGSLGNVSMQTAALFSYIDPIVAIILSALLLRESFGAAQLVGTLLILGSACYSEVS